MCAPAFFESLKLLGAHFSQNRCSLRSHFAIAMTCKCKVGSCGECEASCRRCGCACDGRSPEVALARRRGHRGRGKSARPSWERTPPPAKVLKVSAPFTDDLEDTEEVWTAFGFTSVMKKKLTSKIDRQHGTAERDSPGWCALRQRGGRKCHTGQDLIPWRPTSLVK